MSRSHPRDRASQSLLRLCGSVARSLPGWTSLLISAGLLHAIAHGAVAATAALLGRAIVGNPVDLPYLHASPIMLASMGLVAVFAKGVFGIFASLSQARLSTCAGQTLRDHTIHNLLQAGSNAPPPATIARVVSRIREAEDAVQRGPFSAARAIAQLVPILAGLFLVSPELTLLACLGLVPFAALLALARRRWRRLHESSMNAADSVHEEMDDLVRHLDLWRTYGTGTQVRALLHRLGSRAAKARIHSETIGVTISSANEVLGAAALLAVLFVASLGTGVLEGGSIIAFIALFFMAYRPLRDVGDARTAWLRGREALDTLSKIHAPATPPQPAPPRPNNPNLQVDHLGVPGRSPQVSFHLPPGRMVALAGATGAGKTTLLRALLGLEPSADGLVSLDGQPLLPGQVGPDFRPFAWVPQDAPVVSGSLEDNFHIAGASLKDARERLASLGAGDLERSLGQSKLGIAGRALSGGERRWVSLARALATGWPVLLLDEPTVGLDPDARRMVLDILERTKGRRSLVVASHDDDVLALADEIVVVRR